MFIGTVEIDAENQLLQTHHTTYRLDVLKVATAPRTYLSSSALLAGLMATFEFAFHDILWPAELAALIVGSASSLIFGWHFTHLTFHSRDLSGAAVTGALFGTHGHLNRIRREVMAAQIVAKSEASS